MPPSNEDNDLLVPPPPAVTLSPKEELEDLWRDVSDTLSKGTLEDYEITRMQHAFAAAEELMAMINEPEYVRKGNGMLVEYRAIFRNKTGL